MGSQSRSDFYGFNCYFRTFITSIMLFGEWSGQKSLKLKMDKICRPALLAWRGPNMFQAIKRAVETGHECTKFNLFVPFTPVYPCYFPCSHWILPFPRRFWATSFPERPLWLLGWTKREVLGTKLDFGCLKNMKIPKKSDREKNKIPIFSTTTQKKITRAIRNIPVITHISYQCCVLIGWATSRLYVITH